MSIKSKLIAILDKAKFEAEKAANDLHWETINLPLETGVAIDLGTNQVIRAIEKAKRFLAD